MKPIKFDFNSIFWPFVCRWTANFLTLKTQKKMVSHKRYDYLFFTTTGFYWTSLRSKNEAIRIAELNENTILVEDKETNLVWSNKDRKKTKADKSL